MVVLGTAAFPLMQGGPMGLETGDRWWAYIETARMSGESREKAVRARRWGMNRAFGVGLAAVVVGIAVEILA
jgi:hypothetical protein